MSDSKAPSRLYTISLLLALFCGGFAVGSGITRLIKGGELSTPTIIAGIIAMLAIIPVIMKSKKMKANN